MADSAVNLGMGGSSREGLGEFLDYLRTNRPVYKEGDERPYKYYSDDLMVPEQKSSTFAQRYEFTADRASPYAGMANSLYDMEAEDMLPLLEDGSITSNSIYGKSGSNVPSYVEISPDGSFTETPIGFDDGGEVDPLAGVSNEDKRRILRIGYTNVGDLVGDEYDIFTILTDRQKKGQRNFAEFEDGGEVPIEEAGIMSALLDPRIDLPDRDYQDMVRASGREGSEGSSIYYPEGSPTFEQVLETKYGYPDDVDRGEFYNTSEAMRAERPRHDMPTYQELEDARAHALMSAELAQDLGPDTAEKVGGLGEMFDRYMPVLGTATDADVVMDKRNNAFGANLLRKAGVQASPQEITKMVDQAVFDQLDVVLGRAPGERRFKSPEKGIDIFFPRDKQGFFDINRYD